jgi:hypothetical protein
MSEDYSAVINGKRYFTDENGSVGWEPSTDSAEAELGYVVGSCELCGYEGWVFPLDEGYGKGTHVGGTLCDNCNYCPECDGVMDGDTCPSCEFDVCDEDEWPDETED